MVTALQQVSSIAPAGIFTMRWFRPFESSLAAYVCLVTWYASAQVIVGSHIWFQFQFHRGRGAWYAAQMQALILASHLSASLDPRGNSSQGSVALHSNALNRAPITHMLDPQDAELPRADRAVSSP